MTWARAALEAALQKAVQLWDRATAPAARPAPKGPRITITGAYFKPAGAPDPYAGEAEVTTVPEGLGFAHPGPEKSVETRSGLRRMPAIFAALAVGIIGLTFYFTGEDAAPAPEQAVVTREQSPELLDLARDTRAQVAAKTVEPPVIEAPEPVEAETVEAEPVEEPAPLVRPSAAELRALARQEAAREAARQRAAQEAGPKEYTVTRGDSLQDIAEKYYGDRDAYMRIFEANRDKLATPDQIEVGQRLEIPS